MKYDLGIHRRRSIRLKGYDYSQAGGYFVTICVQNRECVFGEIRDEEVRLSSIGEIVQQEWLRTPIIRPHVELDKFVIMPNHIHGIIIIHGAGRGTSRRAPTMERFGKPTHDSLSTIIRGFKSATTKRVNEFRGIPGQQLWQRNYHEHVIRDEKDYRAIQEYIVNNPLQWYYDQENPERIINEGRIVIRPNKTD